MQGTWKVKVDSETKSSSSAYKVIYGIGKEVVRYNVTLCSFKLPYFCLLMRSFQGGFTQPYMICCFTDEEVPSVMSKLKFD